MEVDATVKKVSGAGRAKPPGIFTLVSCVLLLVAGSAIIAVVRSGDAQLEPPDARYWQVLGGLAVLVGALQLANMMRLAPRRRWAWGGRGRDPERPWEWDYRWRKKDSLDELGRHKFTGWLYWSTLALFLAGWHWLLFTTWHPILLVIMVVWDLILLAFFAVLLFGTIHYWKYGRSRLLFSHFPFRLGEKVSFRLRLPQRARQHASLKWTLRCIEEHKEIVKSRGTDGKSSSALQVTYYQKYSVTSNLEGPMSRDVEVDLLLPGRPELCTQINSPPARYWKFEVNAETEGLDYRSSFLVPVYS